MSALTAPVARGAKSRLLAFRRISQKRVDYALYTNKLELICVVELDDRTHDVRRDAQRDGYLESTGIVTLRWQSTFKPSEAEIRGGGRLEAIRPRCVLFLR